MNMEIAIMREHGAHKKLDEAKQKAADRALELLRQTLQIVDAEDMPPEIGARLDHVICSLQDFRDS